MSKPRPAKVLEVTFETGAVYDQASKGWRAVLEITTASYHRLLYSEFNFATKREAAADAQRIADELSAQVARFMGQTGHLTALRGGKGDAP